MTVADALSLLDLSMPFTESELTNAYRQALAMWSPDRFPEADLRVKAAEKVRKANLAYAVLMGVPNSGGGAAMPLMKKDTPTAPPIPASLRAGVQPAISTEKKSPASEPPTETGANAHLTTPTGDGPPPSSRPRPKALALHLVAPARPTSPTGKKENMGDQPFEPNVPPAPVSPAGSPPLLPTEEASLPSISSTREDDASPTANAADALKQVSEPGPMKDLTLLAPPLPAAQPRASVPRQPSRTESVEDEPPPPLNAWAWVALLLAVLPIVPGLELWAWAFSVVAAVGCAAVAESRAKRLANRVRAENLPRGKAEERL